MIRNHRLLSRNNLLLRQVRHFLRCRLLPAEVACKNRQDSANEDENDQNGKQPVDLILDNHR